MKKNRPRKPHWTGRPACTDSIEGYLLAGSPQGLLLVQVEECEDTFVPVYSTPEKLMADVEYLKARGMSVGKVVIKQITGEHQFCDSIFALGFRIMVDPIRVNEHHTRWTEIMLEGNAYKYTQNDG